MNALEVIQNEVPSPVNSFASNGDWDSVEAKLGLALPDDYKSFIRTYGSGKMCDFISVMSPFVRNPAWSLLPYLKTSIDAYRSYVDSGLLATIPYFLYPNLGGLLPFGTSENGNYLNWLTTGVPSSWKIIVWDPSVLEFIDTDYSSVLDYLVDLIQQRIWVIPGEMPLNWFDPPRHFTAINFDGPEWK